MRTISRCTLEESSRGNSGGYKIRLQKQRPKNFKGHSIGCSDVLVITDEGKTTAYYINKDGFIIVPEFLTIKSSSDTRLSIDTTGYEIEGKKGTWLAQDYILMNEKKWFLMEHEEYGTRAAYVILSEDGAVVMNDCYNGFDEEARRNIQTFMQQQAAKNRNSKDNSRCNHKSSRIRHSSHQSSRKRNQSWQTGRRLWTTENIFVVQRWQKKPTTT